MIFARNKKADQPDEKKKKSFIRGWLDALVFAVVASTLIHIFIFQAYAIPSGSMEGTLLINDHLYVSKLSYGVRLPNTPLGFPLVHNSLPITGGKSYTDAVQWGYHRLPGLGSVERNDIVVFNGPEGDTAIKELPDMNYYQMCRSMGRDNILANYTIISHPVDKREHLIKRCVAIPGDVVEIRNTQLYINGSPAHNYPHIKHTYIVRTTGMAPAIEDDLELVQNVNNGLYAYNLAYDQLAKVKQATNLTAVTPFIRDAAGSAPIDPAEWVFPLDTANYKWNRDNYGPLTIPKAGVTVQLTPQNIALYRRIIGTYEGNTLQEQGSKIIINGQVATSYTFKMNYYWMMGDNRHHSLDSRYWGFVPEDHIAGKPLFVWFAYGEGGFLKDLSWGRLLRSMHALED